MIHLATGAVVNTVWDLSVKSVGKPVWELMVDMSPEQPVRCIDFRHTTDCITLAQALALLTERAEGKAERQADLLAHGYPGCTTSAGWLGDDDAKLRRLAQAAADAGFDHIKREVRRDLRDDQAIEWLGHRAFAKPWFARITARIPLGQRMTTDLETADLVLFLLSDRSSRTTGQWLHPDGGYTQRDRMLP